MKSSRAWRQRLARLLGAALLVARTALGQAPTGAAAAANAGPVVSLGTATSAKSPAVLELTSNSDCPSARAVSDVLGQILGVPAGAHVAEHARLERGASKLVVSLRASDARVLGEHALPLEGDCTELARASAVVLAAWLSDAHPEFVPQLAHAANPDERTQSDAASDRAAPQTPVAAPNGSVRSSGTLRLESTWRARVSATLGAAVLPTPVAVAGSAAFSIIPDAGGIGATLRVGALSPRRIDVQTGEARYFRWPLGAGAVFRFAGRRLATELELGGALGWFHAEGRSFNPDQSANDVTFGPFAAARLGTARGPVRPFLEVWSVVWARSARVFADAAQPSQPLPSLDLTLSLGAAFML